MRGGQIPYCRPKSSLQGLLLGLLCWSWVELGVSGDTSERKPQTPPRCARYGPSGTQTRAGLCRYCLPKAMSTKLTSSTSLPHRPAQRPSEEVTTGTELQLKHADISQAAPVHKGQRHPGQLTQGAGGQGGLYFTPLSCLARGGTPLSPAPTGADTHISRCPDLLHSCPGMRTWWQPHEPHALLRGSVPPS